MSLAEVLDRREGDETTVAIYTATEEITRAELRAQAEALAAVLREGGLRTGQAVGVMLPNGPDIVAALFGVWFAGGVYVPLNPRLSAGELEHVIDEDRPAAIVTRPGDAAPRHRRAGRAGARPRHLVGDRSPRCGRPRVAAGRGRDLVHVGHDRATQAGAPPARQRARADGRRAVEAPGRRVE